MKSIPIIDGRGYVFDIDTLRLLREKYHVAGVLSGVLPQFPQQNIFNGLPLQLLPEEVKYLLESNEFYLVDDKLMHEDAIPEETINIDSQMISIPTKTEFRSADSQTEPGTTNKELVKYTEPSAARYQIYKYLIDRGYFIMPGLRFGCQFMAYPGDLMRYHSHYNVLGFRWNEKFDILDIVNGGRLATSVKKCWVIGAAEPESEETEAYSIEWAGFG